MIGQNLGHYKILEKLGAGGMGEVYRAEDTTLKRQVALKVLPADLAASQERLQRFQREAETLASLDHPNIVHIYTIEEEYGVRFLTMQLVHGRQLSELIPKGGMPLERILDIAIPLTEALAAAHEKGIIHRDLKPGNIMVTDKGQVKVLDFGLAKLSPWSDAGESQAETVASSKDLTRPGLALGTVAYMSPEQALGKELDRRTDLFSLGAVLYEMATGRQPFQGGAAGSILNEIINAPPIPAMQLRPELPEGLARTLDRSLEKDPNLRYQSAGDLMAALKRLQRDSTASASTPPPVVRSAPPARRHLFWIPIASLLILSVTFGWRLLHEEAPPDSTEPLEIQPFTSDGGWKTWPSLSPDGEKVAYVWNREGAESSDLYVKAIGVGTRPLRLTESSADEISPVWSPDGREIAFVRIDGSAAAIYLVPSVAGRERKLADLSGLISAVYPVYPIPVLTWSPDGKWLAHSEKSLLDEPAHIVLRSVETLEKTTLTYPPKGTLGDLFPAFSPDGRHLAFLRSDAAAWGNLDLWIQPVEGGSPRRLTARAFDTSTRPAWTPASDAIVFSHDFWGAIRRVGLEEGTPSHIPGVGSPTAYPTVSGDRLVYQQRAGGHPPDIWRVPGRLAPPESRPPQRLVASSSGDVNQAFSPDGRRIAFSSGRSGQWAIWLCKSDGTDPVQLTQFESHTGSPRWSPDGRHIVFDSLESGNRDVWVVDAEGGVPQQLTLDPAEDGTPFWSRDGLWIYFHSTRSGEDQIWKQPAAGGDAAQVTVDGGFYAEESWDGETLYYVKSPNGGAIWQKPHAGTGPDRELVPGPNAGWGDWTVARSGVYFATKERVNFYRFSHRVHFFDFATGKTTEVLRRDGPNEPGSLAVSPDEEWLLFAESSIGNAELMLAENFR